MDDDELPNRWRVSEDGVFCGTLRIASFDFDTEPPEDFRRKVFEQMERKLNAPFSTALTDCFGACKDKPIVRGD